ncbi:MAG: glutamate racemase [Thermodesulfobacteriota bacterium]|nr:glutamate racemase [Thermodesulfobacteriota bacterium]
MDSAIGIFDSGIGGLTVLKEIMNILPNENTIYLGDTARVPYGIKSAETVIRYSLENAQFLLSKNIKMLVVACNTASAVGLSTLMERFHLPIIGVIEPGARKAAHSTERDRIGIIGTERTIKSGAYVQSIKKINPGIETISKPCPLFVPLVEEGWTDNEIAFLTAQIYLQELEDADIDTLILGCTHYPLLKDVIRKVLGEEVLLVDSAEETAIEVSMIMRSHNLLRSKHEDAVHQFYVTDAPESLIKGGRRFLQAMHISDVKQTILGSVNE